MAIFSKTGKVVDDEYYTTEEQANYFADVVEKHINRDAVILCPCDSIESEIVKVFINRGYKVIYEAGDYKATLEKYKGQFDVIATNPPFSIWAQFARDCKSTGADFFIFFSNTTWYYSSRWVDYEYTTPFPRGSMDAFKGGKKCTCSIYSNKKIRQCTKPVSEWLEKCGWKYNWDVNENDFIGTTALLAFYDISDYNVEGIPGDRKRFHFIKKC